MSTRIHHFARKYQKFPGGACPQTPLAVGAFGTSLCHIRLPLLKILATALTVISYLNVLMCIHDRHWMFGIIGEIQTVHFLYTPCIAQ